jgi:ATP-dependent DNA helicase RecG
MPQTENEYKLALEQFRFEEAFILQTVLQVRRKSYSEFLAVARPKEQESKYLAKLEQNLPFKLTNAQKSAVQQISEDLSQSVGMRRLLQGDVGSGKTVVAVLSMLQTIDANAQAVFVAPTEVLAKQHYENIKELLNDVLEDTEQQIVLLTGSLKAKQKNLAKAQIRSGQAKIIIGTHALFYDLEFSDLGLIVIDEQHRFGVEQRDQLLQDNLNSHKRVPHLLVMSATPIPRTIAMTVFSDLEVSVLREMPKDRKKVDTYIVEQSNLGWTNRMWERVKEAVESKNNVFVVCPRIDNAEDVTSTENAELEEGSVLKITQNIFEKLTCSAEPLEMENVKKMHNIEKLSKTLPKIEQIKGIPLATVHGRMSAEEKSKQIQSFVSLEKPILLATTVIEVGVDIPNATVMIIYDADIFSLATLHQLRGRVGRSDQRAICFLIPSETCTENGLKRLEAIVKTTDGFKIAEADLEIRGEGNVVGANQSGSKTSLKLLKILQDRKVIEEAHLLAKEILEQDPHLEEHAGLRQVVETEIDKTKKEFLNKV